MKKVIGITLIILLALSAGLGVLYTKAEEPVRNVDIESGVSAIDKYQYFSYGYLEKVTVPSSVQSIGFSAFDGCVSLKDVQLSEGLVTLDNRSFAKCKSLTSIEIPDSVLTIGNASFYGCSSLENIKLSGSLTKIDNNLFYQCDSLKNITIPDSVTQIGQQSFYGCRGLKSLVLPENLLRIEDGAFYECRNLEAIEVPSSVNYIGEDAFLGCEKLTIYCESGSYAQKYAMANGIKASAGTILKEDKEMQGTLDNEKVTANDVPKTGIRKHDWIWFVVILGAVSGLVLIKRTSRWDQVKMNR